MSDLVPIHVPSLVQGISQQSPQSRNPASAPDQVNCQNDLLVGARARNGSRVVASHSLDLSGTWSYPLSFKEGSEQYRVLIRGGLLRVINVATGALCTVIADPGAPVSNGDNGWTADSYLSFAGGGGGYCAATLGNATLIANRAVAVGMSGDMSAPRASQGIAHFRSAGYFTTYELIINVTGLGQWQASYTTPDNSTAGNAQFIATNRLAATFASVLTETIFPSMAAAGCTGLAVSRFGSCLRISCDQPFTLRTSDGLGGRQFIAFTDRVKNLTDLPADAFSGYTVAVGDRRGGSSSDYFLRYTGTAQGGVWEEVVKWSTPTALNRYTMPVQLFYTGLNSFTLGPAPWGARVAGDGDRTSQDPIFVGERIRDLQFHDGRLCIVTERHFALSKAGNAYVFFPDTAQTELADAPIMYQISNGEAAGSISHAVVVGGSLMFWGSKVQSRLGSGGGLLTENTTENPPSTQYRYDGRLAPESYGPGSLVFLTRSGRATEVREVLYREDGRVVGEITLTGHVPTLIRGSVSWFEVFPEVLTMLVCPASSPNTLWVYEWFNQGGDQRVRSAWSRWTFPSASSILWADLIGSEIVLGVGWSGGKLTLERLDLEGTSPGSPTPPLRLDHQVSSVSAATTIDLTLPYDVPPSRRGPNWRAVLGASSGSTVRGSSLEFSWLSDNSVRLTRPAGTGTTPILFGRVPVATRELNRPYLVGEGGRILAPDVMISSVTVYHNDSGAYRALVRGGLGRPATSHTFVPGIGLVEPSGHHRVKVGSRASETSITLINDGVFPSAWDSLTFHTRKTSDG